MFSQREGVCVPVIRAWLQVTTHKTVGELPNGDIFEPLGQAGQTLLRRTKWPPGGSPPASAGALGGRKYNIGYAVVCPPLECIRGEETEGARAPGDITVHAPLLLVDLLQQPLRGVLPTHGPQPVEKKPPEHGGQRSEGFFKRPGGGVCITDPPRGFEGVEFGVPKKNHNQLALCAENGG